MHDLCEVAGRYGRGRAQLVPYHTALPLHTNHANLASSLANTICPGRNAVTNVSFGKVVIGDDGRGDVGAINGNRCVENGRDITAIEGGGCHSVCERVNIRSVVERLDEIANRLR